MIHELKQMDNFFADVASGKKTFEVRANDRNYQVGDLLALNEVVKCENGLQYTGRSMLVYIDYILDDSRYNPVGYITMSIKPCYVGYVTSPRDMSKIVGADYSVQILERGEWQK